MIEGLSQFFRNLRIFGLSESARVRPVLDIFSSIQADIINVGPLNAGLQNWLGVEQIHGYSYRELIAEVWIDLLKSDGYLFVGVNRFSDTFPIINFALHEIDRLGEMAYITINLNSDLINEYEKKAKLSENSKFQIFHALAIAGYHLFYNKNLGNKSKLIHRSVLKMTPKAHYGWLMGGEK